MTILTSPPKISCVMTSIGRVELMKRSINCYRNQTYRNRELVILSQAGSEGNTQLEYHLRELNDPSILLLPAPKHLVLGALRNTLVEIATGEIVCQWDDDDLYSSDRLANQYHALVENRVNIACAYCKFVKLFFLPEGNQLYWCDWSGEFEYSHRFLCGTVMFYKELTYDLTKAHGLLYPETGSQCHVEEDLNVWQKLIRRGKVVDIPGGLDYIYVFHGSNLYDLEHHRLTLDTRWGKKLGTKEELRAHRKQIFRLLEDVGVVEKVDIMSAEGVAFTYEPKEKNEV